MGDISIEHGEALFFHELPALLPRLQQPKAVRLLGRCVGARPQQHRVGFADRGVWQAQPQQPQQQQAPPDEDGGGGGGSLAGAQLLVDTTLVAAELAFAVDSLYQVIGELQPPQQGQQGQQGGGPPVLRARVARCVDGMDVGLYEQAVRLRRNFLGRAGLLLGGGEKGEGEEQGGGSRPASRTGGAAVPMAVDGMN